MWEQLQSELKNSKIYVYSVAITVCILSIFGFVIFIATAYNGETAEALPSPTATNFGSILGAKDPNQTQIQPGEKPEQLTNFGPDQPVVPPSPVPSPKISPSPSPTMSPSPSPSLSPSPTPTPTPETTSNSTPSPSTPNKPETEAYCNDSKSKIRVSWNQPSNATTYKVFRDGSELSSPSSTTYIDENVTGGTHYKYKVKALNSTGESGDSEEKEETAKTCS